MYTELRDYKKLAKVSKFNFANRINTFIYKRAYFKTNTQVGKSSTPSSNCIVLVREKFSASQGERGEAGALRCAGEGRGGGRDVRWCDRREGRAYLPQHRDSAARPRDRPV